MTADEGGARRVRTGARVVRVGPSTSFTVLPAWGSGAILVTVPTEELVAVTGLPPDQLLGTELSVLADLDAAWDVRPTGWQLAPSELRVA